MVTESPNMEEVKKKRTKQSLPDAHGPKRRKELRETLTAPSPNPQIGCPKREDVQDHDPKTGGNPGLVPAPAAENVQRQRSIKNGAEKETMTKICRGELQKTKDEIDRVQSLAPSPDPGPERGDAHVPGPNPGQDQERGDTFAPDPERGDTHAPGPGQERGDMLALGPDPETGDMLALDPSPDPDPERGDVLAPGPNPGPEADPSLERGGK